MTSHNIFLKIFLRFIRTTITVATRNDLLMTKHTMEYTQLYDFSHFLFYFMLSDSIVSKTSVHLETLQHLGFKIAIVSEAGW